MSYQDASVERGTFAPLGLLAVAVQCGCGLVIVRETDPDCAAAFTEVCAQLDRHLLHPTAACLASRTTAHICPDCQETYIGTPGQTHACPSLAGDG